MSIIRDQLGDVFDKDGNRIHAGVRIMQDQTKRVAVFAGKNTQPPIAVYAAGEVTFDRSGGCSTCKGWPARRTMETVWIKHDRVTA